METIGLIGLRKVQEDFAAVCKTLKQELANPDLGPSIADEVLQLGNDMDARLDALGEDLAPILKAAGKLSDDQLAALEAKEVDPNQPKEESESDGKEAEDSPELIQATASQPDATGDSSAEVANSFQSEVK